jgi:hypothetical protein
MVTSTLLSVWMLAVSTFQEQPIPFGVETRCSSTESGGLAISRRLPILELPMGRVILFAVVFPLFRPSDGNAAVSVPLEDQLARRHIFWSLTERRIAHFGIYSRGYEIFVCPDLRQSELVRLINRIAPPASFNVLLPGSDRRPGTVRLLNGQIVDQPFAKINPKSIGLHNHSWKRISAAISGQGLIKASDVVMSADWTSRPFQSWLSKTSVGYDYAFHLPARTIRVQFDGDGRNCLVWKERW